MSSPRLTSFDWTLRQLNGPFNSTSWPSSRLCGSSNMSKSLFYLFLTSPRTSSSFSQLSEDLQSHLRPITVCAISLFVAAKQWTALSPPLAGLAFLHPRKSKNALVSHNKALEKLPPSFTVEHFFDCVVCRGGTVDNLRYELKKDVVKLLHDFGLALAMEECLSWIDGPPSDQLALMFLTLDMPRTVGSNTAFCGAHIAGTSIPIMQGHYDSSQALISLSKSFFDLPSDADARFHALLTSGLSIRTGSFYSTGELPDDREKLAKKGEEPHPREQASDSSGTWHPRDEPRSMLWGYGQDEDMNCWHS
ncbi:hypothetical protein JCM8547_006881 [Rhodosporidiobolus lusitaniae]